MEAEESESFFAKLLMMLEKVLAMGGPWGNFIFS
jgi:hypothetical protein